MYPKVIIHRLHPTEIPQSRAVAGILQTAAAFAGFVAFIAALSAF